MAAYLVVLSAIALASCGEDVSIDTPVEAPGAPALQLAGASLKQLDFSWTPVAGGTSYELEKDESGGDTHTTVTNAIDGAATGIGGNQANNAAVDAGAVNLY